MRYAGLEEAQAGIKTVGRNINNLRYADGMTLMTESEEELKSLLMKVKEESENFGLKLNIQKNKIMASGPIISWEIDGETVETLTDLIWGGSKITADSDCSHEIKKRLLLGRKFMTNIDSILKSRDMTLPTTVHQVNTVVFPVVMYGCESWTIKKAEGNCKDGGGIGWEDHSPSQIPQKNISTLSKLHKTTSVGWQRTSGNQKSRPLSSKTGRKKYKRRERRQRRWGGNFKKRGFQTPGNTLPAESVASLGNTEGNIKGRKNK